MQQRMLILGCGYLGSYLVEIAHRSDWLIDALSRNAETCQVLKEAGVNNVLPYALADTAWHEQVNPEDYEAIVLCVGSAESSPDGYRESYLAGNRSVIAWAAGSFTGKLIYTSSISVYGDAGGKWVDENTPPSPGNWRGEIILESEQILRDAFPEQALIMRLGGLYGPGRNRFLRSRQTSPTASAQHYLNLIHVNDAANALFHTIRTPEVCHKLYNLTDNHPVRRSELQAYLRKHDPQPQAGSEAAPVRSERAQTPNRRVKASRIRGDTDWEPAYPCVFDAIPHMV